jgi:hypothetical protein
MYQQFPSQDILLCNKYTLPSERQTAKVLISLG